uniref:hypothetical protein n=1 Tax=Parenemella sanctibonifatiensis TaxID=2016505 RepID=UPI0039835BF6
MSATGPETRLGTTVVVPCLASQLSAGVGSPAPKDTPAAPWMWVSIMPGVTRRPAASTCGRSAGA